MSAASFLSMAGLIAFEGRDGSVYLMGWTGGYVLLALLLAPYLRKFGKFTVPDFVGDRYYSSFARLVAIVCAIFISFTYISGQMSGVGIAFAKFLNVKFEHGVIIGMGIVFSYAVMGGMKGITYTQVAQYCVLIFAYMVPAIFISIQLTNNPVPQLGLGSYALNEKVYLLDKLDQLQLELGLSAYTDGSDNWFNVFCITAALMVGTAGLPHVIIRFFTVPRVRDARISAGWALLFIAILYTTAPAVAVFAKTNLINTVQNKKFNDMPPWVKKWESTGLLAWKDRNGDGKIQYGPGSAFKKYNKDDKKLKIYFKKDADGNDVLGDFGERIVLNETPPLVESKKFNELYVNRDIMVLANPEIAGLSNALVVAGGLAAALSTAAGLLLVISTSISHDLLKKTLMPDITEKQELLYARVSAACAVLIAGYLGINPPGFVAQVVAFAFGLAAASFFPAIILGIFSKRMNKEGAIAGMIVGLLFTASYIIFFKFIDPSMNTVDNWLFGVSPEGIGAIGMTLNFIVSIIVSSFTPPPPKEVQEMVEDLRIPRGKEPLPVDSH